MENVDAGCGLKLREGYEKYHPYPIKFPDGKTYRCPMMPLEMDDNAPHEAAMLKAVEELEKVQDSDDPVGMTAINKIMAGIVRAAIGMVYDDKLPTSLGLDHPTFRKVQQRLLGGEPGNG